MGGNKKNRHTAVESVGIGKIFVSNRGDPSRIAGPYHGPHHGMFSLSLRSGERGILPDCLPCLIRLSTGSQRCGGFLVEAKFTDPTYPPFFRKGRNW
jgi:hypothetical protein